jgi:phage head maturation protease
MAEQYAERDGQLALRTFDGGSVAIREDAAGDGRTISGYAYRWGERSRGGTPETGALREGFDRGAFAAAIAERGERPWPFLDTHYSRGGRTVGAVRFSEDDIGLRYEGRLLSTDSAREYAEGVSAGSDAVSLEAVLDLATSRRERDAIVHRRVPRIGALAGVPYGAYLGATVAIREDRTVDHCQHCGAEIAPGAIHSCPQSLAASGGAIAQRVDAGGVQAGVFAGPVAHPWSEAEIAEIARRTAEETGRAFMERIANAQGTSAPDQYAAYRGLGELILAARDGNIPNGYVRELAERALADVVTTAGANAALLTGNLTVREVAGIVSRGRPAITAFGGPRGLGDTAGLSATWPYYDGTLTNHVGAQSAQKAEITSAAVDIKLGTEALVTYAGGADIAYQLIRRGDPSILDIFGRIILTAWGVVTDAAFVTELETGSVTKDMAEALTSVDFAELTAAAIDMSITVETATGQPAEFMLASSTAFAHFAKLIAAASTQVVVNGSLDLRSLRLAIGNLPLIHVPSITAGKAIVSNSLAAAWFEDGPFQATAEDVAKLGRNVAYWSLGAGGRFIPAGIIEYYDVTP